jgi:hypothetical protein
MWEHGCEMEYYCDNTYGYASCYSEPGIATNCMCSSDVQYLELELDNVSIEDACRAASEICQIDRTLVFPEDGDCSTTWENNDRRSCDREEQCVYKTEISDTIRARTTSWKYAYCWDSGNGTWSCSCDAYGRSVNFEYPEVVNTDMVCSDAIDVCENIDDAELTGEIECERDYLTIGQQWCESSFSCTQEAMLGNLSVGVVGGYFWTHCQRDNDYWDCYCEGDTYLEENRFRIRSEDEEIDVCISAANTCADMISLTDLL